MAITGMGGYFSRHTIYDDFPIKVERFVFARRLVFRATDARGILKLPSLVLQVGDVAYHRWYRELDRSIQMSYLRQVTEIVHGDGGVSAHDADMADAMPALHEFLTSLEGPDGKTRSTSTLGISTDGQRWILRLADRDTGHVGFHAADSLKEALAGLEERLQAGTLDWRVDQFAKKSKKKP